MANGFRDAARAARAGRRRLFAATLLAVVIVLLNIATGGMLSALLRDAAAPLESFGGKIGGAISGSGFFSSRSSLERQITALQDELQQQQLEAAAFQALQAQNSSLASLEHLSATTPGLAAPITSSLVSSPYGTFTIGAGSADSVAQNSLVLAQGGFVVGVVVQVQERQSLVQELFASGVETDVSIDGAQVSASGQGGQALAEVPHGITVAEGDAVIAPSLGNRPIGIVQHVIADPASANSSVYIALPVSLSSLQYVYVTP